MIDTMKPSRVNSIKQIVYKNLLEDKNIDLKDVPIEKVGYIIGSSIESAFNVLMVYYGDELRSLKDERILYSGFFFKTPNGKIVEVCKWLFCTRG